VADAELRRGQREPKAMSAISIPNRKEVALAFGAAPREVRHQGGVSQDVLGGALRC
jgi:hypothetical protein